MLRVRTDGSAERLYDKEKKTAVSGLKMERGMLVGWMGFKLMMWRWSEEEKTLKGCGMHDVAVHSTAVAFGKDYVAVGDVLRGVHFLQYREERLSGRSLVFLAKSTPFIPMTVKDVVCARIQGDHLASGGDHLVIFAADSTGNVHLLSFTLQMGFILRQATPFQVLGGKIGNFVALGGSASGLSDRVRLVQTNAATGEFLILSPEDFHLASSLATLIVSMLPFAAGSNPRTGHAPRGAAYRKAMNSVLLTGGHAVECGSLLRHFLFLTVPLQAEIAERLQQPIEGLMEKVAGWLHI